MGVVEVTSGDERLRVLKRCVEEEPLLREIQPGHWASCHQVPGYEQAQQTIPKLQHKRTVTPQVTQEATV